MRDRITPVNALVHYPTVHSYGMTAAEFLKALMERHNDNPNSLATRSKAVQSTIFRILEGVSREPRLGVRQKLGRTYGFAPEALISEKVRDEEARRLGLLGDSTGPVEAPLTVIESHTDRHGMPPTGYIRLEHLSPSPSMGAGANISEPVQIVQYLDVLEQWVRQEVGSTNPARIKVVTGHGNSMSPTINDKDLVFVDVGCHSIEAAGIYVLDVAGRFILKKVMILSNGTLIIRSDNTAEYPDEERYDLNRVGDSITVCGKVLAWWTLRKG